MPTRDHTISMLIWLAEPPPCCHSLGQDLGSLIHINISTRIFIKRGQTQNCQIWGRGVWGLAIVVFPGFYVREHHRSFIPSTLYSKPAVRTKTQGSHRESKSYRCSDHWAMAPHSHPGNSTPALLLRVIDNPIPKLMLKESTEIAKHRTPTPVVTR